MKREKERLIYGRERKEKRGKEKRGELKRGEGRRREALVLQISLILLFFQGSTSSNITVFFRIRFSHSISS